MDDIYALEQMEQIEKQQRRIEELEQIADAYENAIIEHFVREGDLKQLCRDMYPFIDELGLDTVCGNPDGEDCQHPCDKCEYYTAPIGKRMEQLGLLEGGNNG